MQIFRRGGAHHDRPGNDAGNASRGHEELKALVDGYKGFGILSIIRVLIFRDCRSFLLALVGLLLLVGQWAGPVGFIAFKLESEDVTACPGDGGIWARFVMVSVAMIYFARLTLAALAHKQGRPPAFRAFKMPKWWRLYRHADLIVTSLLYDTFIFLANLLIVFQDRSVNDMVVDVLALEFFTIIDDEFKTALLAYDSTFLNDMVVTTEPYEMTGPRRQSGEDVLPSSSEVEDPGTRKSGAVKVLLSPSKLLLMIVRAVCRIGGPLCAFAMIFYGPYCMGAP